MAKKPKTIEAADLVVEGEAIRKQTGTTETLQIESIRPAIRELERAATWAYALSGDRSGDLPKVVVTVQTKGPKKSCLGWFAHDRWGTREGQDVHEVTVTAEHLDRKPEEIIATIIHETAHLINHDTGEQDCSKSGRHNKRFKETAESLGLEVAEPSDSRGYAYTQAGPELAKKIAGEFKPDVAAFLLARHTLPPKDKKPSKTVAWVCSEECPTVRVAAGKELVAECQTCGNTFERKTE